MNETVERFLTRCICIQYRLHNNLWIWINLCKTGRVEQFIFSVVAGVRSNSSKMRFQIFFVSERFPKQGFQRLHNTAW